MARALVVFESMFGNTKAVAEAVRAGLAEGGQVDVVEVGEAPDVLPGDVDLLVVGAPTHAFDLSRAATRKSAADQATGELVSRGRGVREWLDALAPAGRAVSALAFDTRVKSGWLPGSAAKTITKRLRRLRFAVAGAPTSFHVGGTPGPLLAGEVDRATTWARAIRPASRT
ncbi:flavodoxin family protein [Saccharothrix violaceirubra]|uniref:NAD(P)H dehydrogenase (Quinone) n=1 Tax=Saccharothrix violaceirubra TaxID=413306 RepID=A0A7W7WXB8_9PSEU|nr:flavodoxin domain-containing protein [Saccharothrix violaceirubra]MBB4966932.1 NAD(P)H dehydrogenase (quinone) [Saccharothrix violaceirubra]